jgi:hypothetical protein
VLEPQDYRGRAYTGRLCRFLNLGKSREAPYAGPQTYYIKTAAVDVRDAMTKLENRIAEAGRIQADTNATKEGNSPAEHSTSQ